MYFFYDFLLSLFLLQSPKRHLLFHSILFSDAQFVIEALSRPLDADPHGGAAVRIHGQIPRDRPGRRHNRESWES